MLFGFGCYQILSLNMDHFFWRRPVTDWMEFYNHRSKHQALDYATPWSLYSPPKQMAA